MYSKENRLVRDFYYLDSQPSSTLRYSLMLPENWDGKNQVPLVIALHYGGHGSPFYGEHILTELVEPSLRELGAIIVSPDCPSQDWTQPLSEEYVLALIQYLQDQYQVDYKRTLLTGYSMGGIGAWHLVRRYPDRFTAALIMAANPIEGAEEIDPGLPLYILHGQDDELFPLGNTTRVIVQLEGKGHDITYRILERTTHFETHKYNKPVMDALPWIMKRLGMGKHSCVS